MNRGDIHLADLGQPVGHEHGLRRPIVLVSASNWLQSRPGVLHVLPITSTMRGWPSHVELDTETSGLPVVSYVMCEQLRAISPMRLADRRGCVGPVTLARIDRVLARLLALDAR